MYQRTVDAAFNRIFGKTEVKWKIYESNRNGQHKHLYVSSEGDYWRFVDLYKHIHKLKHKMKIYFTI